MCSLTACCGSCRPIALASRPAGTEPEVIRAMVLAAQSIFAVWTVHKRSRPPPARRSARSAGPSHSRCCGGVLASCRVAENRSAAAALACWPVALDAHHITTKEMINPV